MLEFVDLRKMSATPLLDIEPNKNGISFNIDWLEEIYNYLFNQLKKWLSRRSQRGKITWVQMLLILAFEPLTKPRITYELW
jgi:hypothetical protein